MSVKVTAPKTQAESKVSFVQKVIKGDTYTVLAASAYLPEDEFTSLYFTTKDPGKVFLQPPYEPKYLRRLPSQNNILLQCLEAMEVNIDGTGYELVPVDDEVVNKDEEARIKAFMDEPYPGVSLVSMRRELRRELEAIGWGFLEVLRNVNGELVGLRNVPAQTIRFIRLDAPVQVTKTLMRDGKEVEITFWARERRFAQILGHNQFRYFKEYGTKRNLRAMAANVGNAGPGVAQNPAVSVINSKKLPDVKFSAGTGGDWESDTNVVAPADRATELLCFNVHPDVDSPYGVPRWINQLPSVLGSRKAEEQNLEFFDAGGMPPAIIFIEGGTLAKDTADQLRMYLSGQMTARNRAVVVEAQSSSGSLDSTGQVRTRVERFGADATKDSMFREYDKNSEEHVRTGFRLPPLFIGKAADYSFASASTSYMVAEAQVFQPEREEFDEKWNRTVMKELGAKTCKFKSKPITLKDVATQLEGLKQAMPVVQGVEWVEDMNKVTGLSMIFDKEAKKAADEAKATGQQAAQIGVQAAHSKVMGTDKIDPAALKSKKKSAATVLKMANRFLVTESLVPTEFEVEADERETIRKAVDELDKDDRALFNRFLSARIQQAVEDS